MDKSEMRTGETQGEADRESHTPADESAPIKKKKTDTALLPPPSEAKGVQEVLRTQTTATSESSSSFNLPAPGPETGQGDAHKLLPDSQAGPGYQCVADVFKNVIQETKIFHMPWAQIFGDCENYELFFPSRLDRIIEEANEYEKKLLEQKNILAQRLRALSDTLRSTGKS